MVIRKKENIVLGIYIGTNASAALFKNNTVIACVNEERFTKEKNSITYPLNSVEYCLKAGNVAVEDIDVIALVGFKYDIQYYLVDHDRFTINDWIKEQNEFWYQSIYENKKVNFLEVFKEKIIQSRLDDEIINNLNNPDFRAYIWRQHLIEKHLGLSVKAKIKMYHHHYSHYYYGLYTGEFYKKDCIIFNMEGFGDVLNASAVVWKNGKINKIMETNICNIGRLYRYITLLLGMKPNEHEYKVMGLAPYCSEYNIQPVYDIFKQTLNVDGINFVYKNKPEDHYFYFKKKLEGLRFDAIAAGLQKYTEEIINKWVSNVIRYTGIGDIVFTGGVGMNIKAMQLLTENSLVKSLHVGPSVSDDTISIGVCFKSALDENFINYKEIENISNVYLGPDIDENLSEKYIKEKYSNSDQYEIYYNASPEKIAEFLNKGLIIARCSGRMEFGARALGNRSILAAANNYNMIKKINEKIKSRDFWMPFAPVILDIDAKKYLNLPEKTTTSNYMSISYNTNKRFREDIIAALHPADFTARPQVICKKDNPEYYEIIEAYRKKSGIGALLNTSFNLHGEPIVMDHKDAARVFELSGLDGLIIDKHLIIKKNE